MKALFTLAALLCVISCETRADKIEREMAEKDVKPVSKLQIAKDGCDKNDGKLMFDIGFSFGEVYYYRFRCIPEGVQIRVEE